MPISRFFGCSDLLYEAKLQDQDRTEIDQLNDYRVTGVKPKPLSEQSSLVEDDSLLTGSFEEILEHRRNLADIEARKRFAPLLEKCLDIDIEEWNRLSEEYNSRIVNPLFDIDL